MICSMWLLEEEIDDLSKLGNCKHFDVEKNDVYSTACGPGPTRPVARVITQLTTSSTVFPLSKNRFSSFVPWCGSSFSVSGLPKILIRLVNDGAFTASQIGLMI